MDPRCIFELLPRRADANWSADMVVGEMANPNAVEGGSSLGFGGGVGMVCREVMMALESSAGMHDTFRRPMFLERLLSRLTIEEDWGSVAAARLAARAADYNDPAIAITNGPAGSGITGSSLKVHLYHGTYPAQTRAVASLSRRGSSQDAWARWDDPGKRSWPRKALV